MISRMPHSVLAIAMITMACATPVDFDFTISKLHTVIASAWTLALILLLRRASASETNPPDCLLKLGEITSILNASS